MYPRPVAPIPRAETDPMSHKMNYKQINEESFPTTSYNSNANCFVYKHVSRPGVVSVTRRSEEIQTSQEKLGRKVKTVT